MSFTFRVTIASDRQFTTHRIRRRLLGGVRTLVTGASGLVGANLVRLLLARGHEVRAFVHRDTRGIDGLEVEQVHGDVRDPASLTAACEGIEVVFHLAAVIAVERDADVPLQAVNVDGVRNVVDACVAAGVRRLVHVSSVHALSREPAAVPIDETRPLALGPENHPYDRSKAQGEVEALRGLERGLEVVILEPGGIFGPHDAVPSALGELLVQIAHRKIPALPLAGFWWVDARDVAEACLLAATGPHSGERYLIIAEYGPIKDIGAAVTLHTGVPAPWFSTPLWLAWLTAPAAKALATWMGRRPLYTPASIHMLYGHQNIATDKAQKELGFSPRRLSETYADSIAWLQADGQIPAKRGS